MSNLKLGIIGAGYIAEKHLEVISKIRRLKVVGITSRTIFKAKKLASKFGIKNIKIDRNPPNSALPHNFRVCDVL